MSKKAQRRKVLVEKCEILVEMVMALQPVYRATADSPAKQQLLETTIGAAIWYLPGGMKYWTKEVSVGVLELHHPDSGEAKPKMTKEHFYARKSVARQLLSRNWARDADPASVLLSLYTTQYGTFTLVTKTENRTLAPHQRGLDLENPMEAYALAGVELVKLSAAQLKRVKARDRDVIDDLLGSPRQALGARAGADTPPTAPTRVAAQPATKRPAIRGARAGRQSGPLTCRVDGRTFEGDSLSKLYRKVLEYLVDEGFMAEVLLPYSTSNARHFVSRTNVHPSGRVFTTPVHYRGFHMEAHKARDMGVRHLRAFLRSIGRDAD